MANILHIETAINICSIAISKDAEIIAFQEIQEANHAAQITLLINSCLKQAGLTIQDIKAVALSNGPGSYTSLRVGTSTAKGICYALSIPLIAVDTLEALALAAYKAIGDENAIYCPMIDARRMEVYMALYRPNTVTPNRDDVSIVHHQTESIKGIALERPMSPMILDEHSFYDYFEKNQRVVFCGNGSEKFKNVCASAHATFIGVTNSAQHIVPIGLKYYEKTQFVDTAYHTPEYLKLPNIILSDKRL